MDDASVWSVWFFVAQFFVYGAVASTIYNGPFSGPSRLNRALRWLSIGCVMLAMLGQGHIILLKLEIHRVQQLIQAAQP